jgi:2-haloacid dehalogenase
VDFTGYKTLTFDCYGTLVDWEAGILKALSPMRREGGRLFGDDEVLGRYAVLESRAEKGAYRPYREVLGDVARGMAEFLGVSAGAYANVLTDTIGEWEPFPDTVEALASLGRWYDLAVVSNVDNEFFSHTARKLRTRFAQVITAEEAHSYKPSATIFRRALERIGGSRDAILHVAQSLYHDISPARELGLATVWVNRRQGKRGTGATYPARATADLEVADLATLAGMVESAFSRNANAPES